MLSALVLATTLTIQDYATMPTLSGPRWSPDGTQIVYVLTKADLTRSVYDADVWVINADGTSDRRLTSSPANDNAPRWSPDGTRVAFLSEREGSGAIYVIEPKGGEARKVTTEPTAVQFFKWAPDGKSIAFARTDEPSTEEAKRTKDRDDARLAGDELRAVNVHIVDVEIGKSRRLTSGRRFVNTLDWSPDGKTIAFSGAPEGGLNGRYQADIYIIDVEGGEPRALVSRPGVDVSPVFSPDGKSLAFLSGGGLDDWLVEGGLHVVDAAGGTPREITAAYDRSPENFRWSEDSKTIFFDGPWNIAADIFRVNPDGSGFRKISESKGVTHDSDFSRSRAAYVFETPTTPPEIYVDGRQLTRHNEPYRGRTRGETRVVRWKNPKDGLEIDGLLTLPPGYQRGRVPLLTFVHGGPASRFDLGYLGYLGSLYAPQAMAAEGFAVLRPNPRGTGGYGLKFRRGNRNDWAEMPWLDITSGIDHVISLGIGDEKRLGLMGWSYGGYIATWALGHSDRFKAISIGAPVVDLMSQHGTSDIPGFIPSYYPGLPHELLIAQSPLWHLKKTDAKVLIQHGDADDRVPPGQSMMLYRELGRLGVDVKLVMYPRSPHVPREPKLRIDVARRNLELFRENVK